MSVALVVVIVAAYLAALTFAIGLCLSAARGDRHLSSTRRDHR